MALIPLIPVMFPEQFGQGQDLRELWGCGAGPLQTDSSWADVLAELPASLASPGPTLLCSGGRPGLGTAEELCACACVCVRNVQRGLMRAHQIRGAGVEHRWWCQC